MLRTRPLNDVNAEAVERERRRSASEVLARFHAVHAELVERIATMPPATWSAPPTPRSRRSLGSALGRILGGPAGDFAHGSAHLGDLEAFVRRR